MTLSVIIPTYNDAQSLPKAIDSILNQKFSDFELIIVNDGSTDNTDDLVKQYMLKDQRIKYFKNERNLGVVKTLNKGFSYATGEYVYAGSSNDWTTENFFEKGMNALIENPQMPLCFFDVIMIHQHSSSRVVAAPFKDITLLPSKEMGRLFRNHLFFRGGGSFIVKTLELKKRGFFNENFGFCCDMFSYCEIALDKGGIYIPEVSTYISRENFEKSERDTNRYKRRELSQILRELKKDRPLFRKMCYSTILARSYNRRIFTVLLKPIHWDMALPMALMKLTLLFRKIGKKILKVLPT